MVAAKSSRVNRQYKKKYRIRNWREYERGLRSRGDVTIWLSEDAIAAWVPPKKVLQQSFCKFVCFHEVLYFSAPFHSQSLSVLVCR